MRFGVLNSVGFLVVGLLIATASDAATPLRTKFFGSKSPVAISSDTMTVLNKKGVAIWRGAVTMVQDDMTLKCNELETAYEEKGKGSVTTMVARGQVHLTQPGRIVRSAHAVFDNRARTITFTGAPRVLEGENSLEGDRIVVWVDDDRVEVTKARGKMKIREKDGPRAAGRGGGAR